MNNKQTFHKLKEQEREARKEIIINAAERIFASKPFNKVTMRDIAKEAGISPASIYRYFPDQQTLFVDAFLRGSKKITQMVNDLISENDEDFIEHATEHFLDYLTSNDQYFRMMTHFMLDGSLNDESLERLNKEARDLMNEFEKLFLKLNPNGDYRLLAHAFFAAMNGILITFRDYPGRDRNEVIQHMQDIGKIIAKMFRHEVSSMT